MNYLFTILIQNIYSFFFFFFFFLVKPYNYDNRYTFTRPASSIMTGIIDLHHTIFFYLIIIFVLIFWLLFYLIYFNSSFKNISYFSHCSALEIIWTIFPSLIIGAILIPSLALLHSSDELVDPEITLKVVGHQWYWSYEYSDFNTNKILTDISFDSYIKSNWINLLSDPILILPSKTIIRFLITSEDVIHSWAIPSWGIKMDAIPGRLNQVIISLYKPGLYYGQCSEICGIGHGFMPITIEVVPMIYFLEWLYYKNFYSLSFWDIPCSYSGMHEYVYESFFSINLKRYKYVYTLQDFFFDDSLKSDDYLYSILKNECIQKRLSKKKDVFDLIDHLLLLNYIDLKDNDEQINILSDTELDSNSTTVESFCKNDSTVVDSESTSLNDKFCKNDYIKKHFSKKKDVFDLIDHLLLLNYIDLKKDNNEQKLLYNDHIVFRIFSTIKNKTSEEIDLELEEAFNRLDPATKERMKSLATIISDEKMLRSTDDMTLNEITFLRKKLQKAQLEIMVG